MLTFYVKNLQKYAQGNVFYQVILQLDDVLGILLSNNLTIVSLLTMLNSLKLCILTFVVS